MPQSLRILIIGGSRFYGRFVTELLLSHGHQLTLINRGQSTSTDASFLTHPNLTFLQGDRDKDIPRLTEGLSWDVCFDTCAYFPRQVEALSVLADRVNIYVYVSSVSAYANPRIPADENSPLMELEDPNTTELLANYGGLKVACERAAERIFSNKTLILRPGLIVGPRDHTDRFTYWVSRLALGGNVLAPDTSADIQFIDARDLAAFTVSLIEDNVKGIFNITGPSSPLTLRTFLEQANAALNNPAQIVYVDPVFLVEHNVKSWQDIPLWTVDAEGIMRTNCEKALKAGLTFRSLEETVKDTMKWVNEERGDGPILAGMSREREKEVLKEWEEATKTK